MVIRLVESVINCARFIQDETNEKKAPAATHRIDYLYYYSNKLSAHSPSYFMARCNAFIDNILHVSFIDRIMLFVPTTR